MLNEPFLELRRQGKKKVHVAKNTTLAHPDSQVRSFARPREFVNSWSKFAELGPPFSVSMALHPFQLGLAGLSPSPFPLSSFSRRSASLFHLEENELEVGDQYHRPLHPASFPSPFPRTVPCHYSYASHHRRLPREELGRPLSLHPDYNERY